MIILYVYRDFYKHLGIPYQTHAFIEVEARIGHELTTIPYTSDWVNYLPALLMGFIALQSEKTWMRDA
ncbi:MAG: hypothetical protein NPIRA02_27390 [Nitrospirales bacterium]|nr:MAG: hypothetical protein NPIRA02_27390 [Nitrospirales bacterium]